VYAARRSTSCELWSFRSSRQNGYKFRTTNAHVLQANRTMIWASNWLPSPSTFPRHRDNHVSRDPRIPHERISTCSGSARIWIELDRQSEFVTVRIRDFGKGLPEESPAR
jgi:hypothetical protein